MTAGTVQLRRIRWAVRAALALGVAASVTANVLHAADNPVSQAVAAWPPLALLLTVELISRVPVHHRALGVVRFAAAGTIAAIAAWISYHHMAAVAARYGETGASAYLLPISVDGLIVIASISLVELAGRIRAFERLPESGTATDALTVLGGQSRSDGRPQDRTGPALLPAAAGAFRRTGAFGVHNGGE
jgi:hypothetical protein